MKFLPPSGRLAGSDQLVKWQFICIDPIIYPIKTVSEGDLVPDANGLQIFSAPGHTAGQITLFYAIKEALLFAADMAEKLKRLKPSFDYQPAAINQNTIGKIFRFSIMLIFSIIIPQTRNKNLLN